MTRLATISLVALLTAPGAYANAEAGGSPQLRVGLARHRTSVVIGAAGSFVLTAGEQELRGERETWSICLPSAVAPHTPADERSHKEQVYIVAASGATQWAPLPVRLRSRDADGAGLSAGADEKSLRRYEGELEVARDAAGMLCLINVVDLEGYARGVVCAEMEPDYPAEALKAQVVAIRSMALANRGRHRADGFDLCAEPHCQAYRGITGQMPAGNGAVEATRGEILTFDGRPACAVYHAICGGHTESSSNAWGGADIPYLRGVPDRASANVPAGGYSKDDERLRTYLTGSPPVNCRQPDYADLTRFRWVRVLRREQVEKSLANMINVGEVIDLRPLERGVSGRIMRLEVVGRQGASVLSPELVIRRALGDLPSSAFVVDRYCDEAGRAVVFVLWGAGWGHGVGMCQAGAAGMAKSGYDYRAILAKYYPGTQVETIY